MAYIPTIHTFEDDVNENRGFDEAPISGGVNSYNSGNNILVPEKKSSSLTKKILTFIAILFLLASLVVVGYYFYTKWQASKEEARLNAEAEAKQAQNNEAQQNLSESDLYKIFPLLAPGIYSYVSNAIEKNNVVILTIAGTADNNAYSMLYAYILAHKKDLNSDLYYAFKVNDMIDALKSDDGLDPSYTSQMNSDFNNSSSSENMSTTNSYISKPIPVAFADLVWESKTLQNKDFEIASAGVTNLVYGYVGHQYVVFTTSLKDFLDTVSSLQ